MSISSVLEIEFETKILAQRSKAPQVGIVTAQMASNNERLLYLNDTKGQVRNKLNLQGNENDEVFSGFEVNDAMISIGASD